MLPPLENPRVLDVGCGRGDPTLELARLSQGQVIGIDVDDPYLRVFARKARESGLVDRVHAVKCSMFEIAFREGCFDLVWAEGSIFVIGFERGLVRWRRLISPRGFLVVHEMVWLRPDPPPEIYAYWKARYPEIGTVSQTRQRIPACGYDPVGCFALPEDAWWTAYYGPLEARLGELREKYASDSDALAVLERQQREVELFKSCQRWYGSAFFVMQKQRRS